MSDSREHNHEDCLYEPGTYVSRRVWVYLLSWRTLALWGSGTDEYGRKTWWINLPYVIALVVASRDPVVQSPDNEPLDDKVRIHFAKTCFWCGIGLRRRRYVSGMCRTCDEKFYSGAGIMLNGGGPPFPFKSRTGQHERDLP